MGVGEEHLAGKKLARRRDWSDRGIPLVRNAVIRQLLSLDDAAGSEISGAPRCGGNGDEREDADDENTKPQPRLHAGLHLVIWFLLAAADLLVLGRCESLSVGCIDLAATHGYKDHAKDLRLWERNRNSAVAATVGTQILIRLAPY
jgi:hypothetical protein